jgi:Domain of unknown function (DUF6429)
MEYDHDKVAKTVLALMWLNIHGDKYETRAWKGFDWDAMERLHAQGYISDPKSKAKSVALTDEGLKRSGELFRELFGTD